MTLIGFFINDRQQAVFIENGYLYERDSKNSCAG